VFSGGTNPPQWERPFERMAEDTAQRCEFGAWLFHRSGAVPILVSGGTDRPAGRASALAMRDFLERWDVPPAMIWTEEKSRSTHENAAYSAEILRQHGVKRVALVVDSQSMRRAEACFRKEGIEVVPAPSGFRYLGSWREEWLPSWKAIRRNEITLHETLGLLWYRWKGWI
jgi:uncharacterized SAM-binding protein YcdF (DUF218 family)